MKKMFIFLILLILSMNYTNTSHADFVIEDPFNPTPDYCYDFLYDNPDVDYTVCPDNIVSLADKSGYERIEKIDGIWYGVIDITDIYVASTFFALNDFESVYMNVIGITFTRDTQNLEQIEIDYVTVQDSCLGVVAFDKYCIGSTADSYEGTYILNNSYNSSNFLDFLRGDEIYVGDDEYDYYLYIEGPELASVTVVKFTYVLTHDEVDDLRLDIQEQYELEYQMILENPLLTADEKLIQIVALMEEYKDYEIDYDQEMTSICIEGIHENCTAINLDTTADLSTDPFADMPDWAKNMVTSLLKGVGILVGAVAGVSFVGIIAYMFVKKGLETTGSAALTGTKLSIKSGSWWGSMFGTGVLAVLGTVVVGIKSLPWWGKLALASITVSSILFLI